MHLIADAAHIEDHVFLAIAVDQTLEFADHAPTTFSLSAMLAR
jgi:hypothetical protein